MVALLGLCSGFARCVDKFIMWFLFRWRWRSQETGYPVFAGPPASRNRTPIHRYQHNEQSPNKGFFWSLTRLFYFYSNKNRPQVYRPPPYKEAILTSVLVSNGRVVILLPLALPAGNTTTQDALSRALGSR